MSRANQIELKLHIDTSEAVKQVAALSLLVSQVGFALDNYLVNVHRAETEGSVKPQDRGTASA